MLCALCHRDAAEPLRLAQLGESCCLGCAWGVGRLIRESPQSLLDVWPALRDDDDGSPEPRLRLPDGSTVEIRERTSELKTGLTVEQRLELAEMLSTFGLLRERLMEAGFVLASEVSAALAQRALEMLFAADVLGPQALERLRPRLRPS